MTNRRILEILVQKGIIQSADLASGGALNTEQANKFIDYVVDQTMLRQFTRVVKFKPSQYDIDKIGVGDRVSMPADEARDPGLRRGVTTSKVSLNPVKVMTPFEISDEFKELNIEGDGISDHIVQMMSRRTGNDLEELFILGNTVGPAILESEYVTGGSSTAYRKDSFLALINGWLKLAESGNLVDFSSASLSASIFSQMIMALPEKFRRNRRDLVFMASWDLEQLWRERLSTRATATGDKALAEEEVLKVFGVDLMPVPLFPFRPKTVENVTFTGSGSTVSLTYEGIESGSVVVTPTTLGVTAQTPYVETTDYTVDLVNGTITHAGGGSSIGTTATVKVTYNSSPKLLLTLRNNPITAIGRDIRIEKDRDIFAGVDQYAISTKVDAEYEEITAVVLGYNIAPTL